MARLALLLLAVVAGCLEAPDRGTVGEDAGAGDDAGDAARDASPAGDAGVHWPEAFRPHHLSRTSR